MKKVIEKFDSSYYIDMFNKGDGNMQDILNKLTKGIEGTNGDG